MKTQNFIRIALLLGLAEAIALGTGSILLSTPAPAQFWGDSSYQQRPQRAIPQQQQQFNPFGGFFQQPIWQPPRATPRPPRAVQRPPPRLQVGDFSKAPPPKKPDTPPTTNILVMGDAMADWLGHGLEEAYADNPEFGLIRKVRANSGLIRNEGRTEPSDWVEAAREYMTAEKPDVVVMILGLSDRTSIRERPRAPARPGQLAPAQQGQQSQQGQQPQQGQQGQAAAQAGHGQAQQGAAAQQGTEAKPGEAKPEQPEPSPSGPGGATHEFRSEKWGELYGRRIDDTIAALKSKGVPVLWVGLPPIRGTRARADVSYLNDLYRARAQKAGITYVDVWDGSPEQEGTCAICKGGREAAGAGRLQSVEASTVAVIQPACRGSKLERSRRAVL